MVIEILTSTIFLIYEQDALPRIHIALWKSNLEEPKFNQSDPSVIISDSSTKTRVKLAAVNEADKQQLQWFCNACKGIPQVMHPNFPFNTQPPVVPATAPSSTEDVELAMALNASVQSVMETRPPHVDAIPSPGANASSSNHGGWSTSAAPPPKGSCSGWEIQEAGPSGNPTQHVQNQSDIPAVVQAPHEIPTPPSLPSAPPIDDVVVDDGPIHYPSIDSSPIDLSSPRVENLADQADDRKEDSSSCVICLDAPVEGACIPCGHMAGCMSCLNEVKAKKWGCPVCRAKIDQVVRLYTV
ncbi:hypothetical protein CsSME_00020620 [Camellia sinensis var. sinensis]